MTPDIVAAVGPVAATLGELGVRFHVGGSVASSLRGVARTTLDVDLVADLRGTHVAALVQALEPTYYVSAEAVREAVRTRASFNLIHLETMLKVDVFVLKRRAYDQESFGRASLDALDPADDATRMPVSSAEDIVLHKLEWYRLGGEISERQWLDVLGVLRVHEGTLDDPYLDRWAGELGLSELLSRARDAARGERGQGSG